MALIECPTCAEPMAWGAKACPHCGAVSPRVHKNRGTLVAVVVFTLVIAALCYAALHFVQPSNSFKLTSVSTP